MSDDTDSTHTSSTGAGEPGQAEAPRVALVLCHAAPDQAHRVGEVFLLPPRGRVTLGRGEGAGPRALLVRQRPGHNEPTTPLDGKRLSREQLRLAVDPSGDLLVDNIGRCPMTIDGLERTDARLAPGAVIALRKELLLLVTRRPLLLPPLASFPRDLAPPFGLADPLGLVGEGPALWALREQVAFVARRNFHTLVLGDSGTGKELVARALHRLSPRHRAPFVARNAATLPPGLIDAELFGNVKNFPNPGMPERPGLVGEAEGGTLFLDEIGEIPEDLQAHLLRLLDGGDYHRLGEGRPRRADLRLVAATNRPLDRLKHDLLARFTLRLKVPPLDARRDDIPLLAQHLLREGCRDDPEVLLRFADPGPPPRFRLSPALVGHLLTHGYQANLRELASLLWQAISESDGDTIDLPPDAHAQPPPGTPALDRDAVESCLRRHDGVIERAWRELGLKNRFALMRLIKKFHIEVQPSLHARSAAFHRVSAHDAWPRTPILHPRDGLDRGRHEPPRRPLAQATAQAAAQATAQSPRASPWLASCTGIRAPGTTRRRGCTHETSSDSRRRHRRDDDGQQAGPRPPRGRVGHHRPG